MVTRKHQSHYPIIVLFLLGIIGCNEKISSVDTTSVSISGWDTSLAYNGFNPLASESMARAVVSGGTNGRIETFLKKCGAGGVIRVGFIGGSVTAGAAASQSAKRYSSLLCTFLSKYFPNAIFVEINAGIGGTDSRFGVSRLKSDILDLKPDLVLMEYAVNDDLTCTRFFGHNEQVYYENDKRQENSSSKLHAYV